VPEGNGRAGIPNLFLESTSSTLPTKLALLGSRQIWLRVGWVTPLTFKCGRVVGGIDDLDQKELSHNSKL